MSKGLLFLDEWVNAYVPWFRGGALALANQSKRCGSSSGPGEQLIKVITTMAQEREKQMLLNPRTSFFLPCLICTYDVSISTSLGRMN